MSNFGRLAIVGSMIAMAQSGIGALAAAGRNVVTAGAPRPAVRRSTVSSYTSTWGYGRGPGWSAAHVKRMAKKRRNVARHKRAKKGGAA